ncbi:MAG TPA: DUF6580 family putative transport protein [Terriglobales bacterium]|nr:DUF6580 family putative transport protein [Terriglobales bacterium]
MLAYLFVALAIALRFLPPMLNFTPVGASLLYFGARQPRRRMWIPLLMLAASDVVLNRFVYGYPFTGDLLITWAWYAAIALMGGLLRENHRPLRIAGAALATSVSFFLVSNFAVWAVWSMYPKTLDGLLACYAAAVPFFRNTVASDLVFTAAFFGLPALVASISRAVGEGRSAAA